MLIGLLEKHRKLFNAITFLLVAMLSATFVRIAVGLVLVAAAANAVAAVFFVIVIAWAVWRASARREPD